MTQLPKELEACRHPIFYDSLRACLDKQQLKHLMIFLLNHPETVGGYDKLFSQIDSCIQWPDLLDDFSNLGKEIQLQAALLYRDYSSAFSILFRSDKLNYLNHWFNFLDALEADNRYEVVRGNLLLIDNLAHIADPIDNSGKLWQLFTQRFSEEHLSILFNAGSMTSSQTFHL